MRVTILSKATLDHFMGGIQVHCEMLARGLAMRGHEVTIVTTRHPDGKKDQNINGVRTVFLDTRTGSDTPAWLSASAQYIADHASSIDVIYSESYAASGYARSRQQFSIPYVICIQGFWSSYIPDQYHEIKSAADAIRWLLIKIPESFYGTYFIERPAIRAADRCIVVTRDLGDELRRRYGLSAEKIAYIPNGAYSKKGGNVSEARFKLRREWKLPENAKVLITSCVLSRQKGVQIAIKAYHELKSKIGDLALIVVGHGPYAEQLKALAAGDSRIIFTGQLPNEKLVAGLVGADIFLCPTIRREGLPLAALEALGAGLPVIASRMGGLPDVVEEGKNGFLLAPGDAGGLRDAIAKIVGDSSLRQKMGAFSRQKYESQFTAELMVQQTEDLLKEVARKRE